MGTVSPMDSLHSTNLNLLSEPKVEMCSHVREGYPTSHIESPPPEAQYTIIPTHDPRGSSSSSSSQGVQNQVALAGPNHIPKIANPAPLGLCAFALTSFVSNFVNVYAKGNASAGIDVGLPLAYGGLTQVFAGIWEMAVGNTFGATSFCSYGAYWIVSGIMSAVNMSDTNTSNSQGSLETLMGVFLLAWFIFTTLMLFCTLRSSVAMFLLFFFLDMNYLLLGIGHLRCDSNGIIPVSFQRVGGIFGILASLAAWYNAFAGLFDESNGFFTVPLGHFPWSPAARAHRSKVKHI